MTTRDPRTFVEELVIAIHRRNGGSAVRLDFDSGFLSPRLKLDSLDLAEVFAQVERDYHVSPFDSDKPPRTWGELVKQLAAVPG